MAAAACGGHVYAVGGREGFCSLGTAERLHLAEGRWESLPSMTCRRRFLAATALQGKLYPVGGEDDWFVAQSAVEVFDPSARRWEQVPPMPSRRIGLAAVALRGKLFAIGGGQKATSQSTQAMDVVEVYDPSAERWSTLSPMPSPRMFLAAATMSGKLYVFGGSDGAQAQRSVDRFEEESDNWVALAPMRVRRVFFAAAVLCG